MGESFAWALLWASQTSWFAWRLSHTCLIRHLAGRTCCRKTWRPESQSLTLRAVQWPPSGTWLASSETPGSWINLSHKLQAVAVKNWTDTDSWLSIARLSLAFQSVQSKSLQWDYSLVASQHTCVCTQAHLLCSMRFGCAYEKCQFFHWDLWSRCCVQSCV